MTVHETMKILNFLRGYDCNIGGRFPFVCRDTFGGDDEILQLQIVQIVDVSFRLDSVLETVKRYVTGSIGRYGNREMYDDYGGDYYFDSLNHSARLGNGGDYKRFPPSPGEIVELLSRRKSFLELSQRLYRLKSGSSQCIESDFSETPLPEEAM